MQSKDQTISTSRPIAIFGMQTILGSCFALTEFEDAIYRGKTLYGKENGSSPPRGQGWFPSWVGLSPAESLLVQAVRGALADACRPPDASLRAAMVVLGDPALLQTMPQSAAEGASQGFAGIPSSPLLDALQINASLILPDGANRPAGFGSILEWVGRQLADGSFDFVLLTAVSSPASQNGRLSTADQREDSHLAAAALVFAPWHPHAFLQGRPYAIIEGLASRSGDTGEPDHLRKNAAACAEAAQALAGVKPGQIDYLECLDESSQTGFSPPVLAGLAQAYQTGTGHLTCGLGSIQSNRPLQDAVGFLAGIAKAALCLHRRYIPALPGWQAPEIDCKGDTLPFYAPPQSRPWFIPKGERRRAAIHLNNADGSCTHLILAEGAPAGTDRIVLTGATGFHLIPLFATHPAQLQSQIENLQRELAATADLPSLSRKYLESHNLNSDAPFCLCVVGENAVQVLDELAHAEKGVAKAQAQSGEWSTPLGSYFTAQPLGRQGGIAFVYPGGFNSYLGMGSGIFRIFPGLDEQLAETTNSVGAAIHERLLYPRSFEGLNSERIYSLEAELNRDAVAMLISGTTLSMLYTTILRDYFGVQPAAAFGYSLGEISMLFANGAWRDGDLISQRLKQSDLFRTRLSGRQEAVREHWGLAGGRISTSDESIWSNFLLMVAPERVWPALAQEDQVYLTHINTPRQVVIGGDPAGCLRVIEQLKCPSLKAPFDHALHCEAIQSEYPELAALHTLPIYSSRVASLYSAADFAPLELEPQVAANKIAGMLVQCLDFPRLIRQVYHNGTRIFLELGAGGNCSRWINETLKGEPHLATTINRKGVEDYASIVRVIARLVSHGAAVDLSLFYRRETISGFGFLMPCDTPVAGYQGGVRL